MNKVQFVLTGLQRGLLVDTAVKAALIKAVLFGVVLRSLISWKSWRTLAQGSPMGIVPCVDPECHGMTMLFACVALATAEVRAPQSCRKEVLERGSKSDLSDR